MKSQKINSVKLGIFVLSGVLTLIIALYLIGKNRQLFGSNYMLRARFENVAGLVAGNNVRYSGIVAGTVKELMIINDTTIEITMTVSTSMQTVIRKNAIVSIGADGLLGNKVIDISPSQELSPFAEEGDLLETRKALNTDEMLRTLYKTNNNIAEISEQLIITVERLNSSSGLWNLLKDEDLSESLHKSLDNIRLASSNASIMMADVHGIITDVKNGKGTAGVILRDTILAYNITQAVNKIKTVADNADSLAKSLDQIVKSINNDINYGKGPANAILRDSLMVQSLQNSLDNIEKGTASFNENMEAMKHNFLFRGYFNKQEAKKMEEEMKQQKKQK